MNPIETLIKKCDISKIKVGDKMSTTYYMNVKAVDLRNSELTVEDQNGLGFKIKGKALIEETVYTANQYSEVKKVNRTELVEILENAGDTVFTVNFYKQANEDSVLEVLRDTVISDLGDPKKLKRLAKDLMKGGERTLTGHLLTTEAKMGRTSVVDLEVPIGQHNIRLVDHRGINWIIFKGIKYQVK